MGSATSWAELAGSPDAADIIVCQGLVPFDADVVRADLSAGYDAALALGGRQGLSSGVSRRPPASGVVGLDVGDWLVR